MADINTPYLPNGTDTLTCDQARNKKVPDASGIDFANKPFTVAFSVFVSRQQPALGYYEFPGEHIIIEKMEVVTNGEYCPFSIAYVSDGSRQGYILARRGWLGNVAEVASPPFYLDDKFHHVAYVRSIDSRGRILQLYIDGKLVGQAPDLPNTAGSNSAFYLGCRGTSAGPTQRFAGQIKDLQILGET